MALIMSHHIKARRPSFLNFPWAESWLTSLLSQHFVVVCGSLAGAALGFRYVDRYRKQAEDERRAWVEQLIEQERRGKAVRGDGS